MAKKKSNTLQKDIPISAILVEDRVRVDFGEETKNDERGFLSLKNSIAELGLIQPIAVTPAGDATDTYKLLAGGRRLRACTELGFKTIAANVFNKVTHLEEKQIELIENLERKDLTWFESASLRAAIDKAMKDDKGTRKPGQKKADDKEVWGTADTAELAGVDKRTIHADVELVEAAEIFPELANCSTRGEAIKKMQRIKGESKASSPAPEDPKVKAELEKLKTILLGAYKTASVFDPKEIKKIKEMNISLVIVQSYKSDKELETLYETISRDAWLVYAVESIPEAENITLRLQNAGFLFKGTQKLLATWSPEAYSDPQVLQRNYSEFVYARKGLITLNTPGHSCMFSLRKVPNQLKTHPNELPVEFWQDVIQTFCGAKSSVLITDAYEGNSILGAVNARRRVIGYDVLAKYKFAFDKKIEVHQPGEYTSYFGDAVK